GQPWVDLEQRGDLRDRPRARRRDLFPLPRKKLGLRGHRPRELDVGGVAALRAHRDLVLAGRAGCHELVGTLAAHQPGVRLDDVVAQSAAIEDLAVRAFVRGVRTVEGGLVRIEGVRVLHHELARAEDTGTWARFVPLLRLDLVPDLREVAVRANLARREPRDDFLVRHAEAHVTT